MNLGIIVAMEEELDIILDNLEDSSKSNYANNIFYTGIYQGKQITLTICGIGKVNAAMVTQILIDKFNINTVINIGVAGGILNSILPGDVVIGNSLIQHDVDATAFGENYGQIPRMDTLDFKSNSTLVDLAKSICLSNSITFHVGKILSGDQFIASSDKVEWLFKEFDGYACEMEGASIAHVCYLNNIPFLVLRSISDNARNSATADYNTFKPIAIKNSSCILDGIIKNI